MTRNGYSKQAQQLRVAFMRRLALNMAEAWLEYLYPLAIDEVVYPGGKRIEVIVREYKSEQDTKPVGGKSLEIMSDRSSEA